MTGSRIVVITLIVLVMIIVAAIGGVTIIARTDSPFVVELATGITVFVGAIVPTVVGIAKLFYEMEERAAEREERAAEREERTIERDKGLHKQMNSLKDELVESTRLRADAKGYKRRSDEEAEASIAITAGDLARKEGVAAGVSEAVAQGVAEGVADGVKEGVSDAVAEGVAEDKGRSGD